MRQNSILDEKIYEDAVLLAIYYLDGGLNEYYAAKLIGEDFRGGYDKDGNPMSNKQCMQEAWKVIREANRRLGWY